jgi:quinohemoprotein ethanol dehydrogenase
MKKRLLVAVLVMVSGAVLVRTQSTGLSPGAKEWSAVSGDLGNTRYTTLTQINRDTLSKLKGAWTTPRFDDGGGGRAMPVMKDGKLFITAGSYVYAYDAKTGALVWKHQTGASPPSAGLGDFTRPEQGLPDREGVAVGDGMVFVGLSNAHAIALDEKTGNQIWDSYAGIDPPRPGQGISGAPLYAGGLVFVGTSADPGFRGKVVAFDGKTGKKAWEFFVVPSPDEAGHETWPPTDTYKVGGGAIWLVGGADPDLGLVYFGTGNGVPQYAGDERAGTNLYLCSLIALDIKTGKLKWYYQTIKHDIWEADIAMSPIILNTQIAGRERKLIAAMRTDGVLFVVDRETGKPILPIEDRKVAQDKASRTWPTQPYPVGADRMLDDCDTWNKKPIPLGFKVGCFFTAASMDVPNLLTPAWGMRQTPMAYSPQTGYIYALGNSSLQWFRRAEDPYVFILGAGRVPGMPQGHGVMAAIDAKTAKIAWKQEFTGPRPSGALATASGLLFQTMPDGNLQARDAKTGEMIWQYQTGMNGGAAPGVSYEVDGEQHIAIAGRNSIMALTLNGTLEPKAEEVAGGGRGGRGAGPAGQGGQGGAPGGLFNGPIADNFRVEIASYVRDNSSGGVRMYTDEHAFNPYRIRVKAGTMVRWVNNGRILHTIAAEDGSWTSSRLVPLEAHGHTFDTPGEYTVICKDHPFAKMQVIVTP